MNQGALWLLLLSLLAGSGRCSNAVQEGIGEEECRKWVSSQTWSRTPGCGVTGKVPKTTGKGRRKPTLVLAMRVVGFDIYQKAACIRAWISALWIPEVVILPASFGRADTCL